MTAHLTHPARASGAAAGTSRLLVAAMIAGQVAMTWLSVRGGTRPAAVPAGLLAAACLVSAVSRFFDGGFGNVALKPGMPAYQVLLLIVTGTVGVLAPLRAHQLTGNQPNPSTKELPS